MIKRKRIGLDFDDVLIDFNGGLSIFCNENYGTSYSKEHITERDYSIFWGCKPEEALRRIQEFIHSSHHARVPPIIGAVNAIKHLKEKYDLFVITARDESISSQTFALMDKHFPKSFKDIFFYIKTTKMYVVPKEMSVQN